MILNNWIYDMKRILSKHIIVLFILSLFLSCNVINQYNAPNNKFNKILCIDAQKEAGFNFPYLLYVPKHVKDLDKSSYILFKPNNPHGKYRDNVLEVDKQDAANYQARMRFIVNDKKSNFVLFTPILPRPFNTPLSKYNAACLCKETMTAKSKEYIVIKIKWTGEKLWGPNNTVGYNLDDIFVVRDGLLYRCIASIPNAQIRFKNTREFEFSFIIESGWDINKPFNFIEHCTSGCFLFKDVYVKKNGSINNKVYTWPDSRVNIEKIFYSNTINEAWTEDGSRVEHIENKIQRVDLQVINMLQDAKLKLQSDFGIHTHEKVFMHGYSGSAIFTQRFSLVHPELVKAAAIGAPGGTYSLCLPEWQGKKLRYPLGISDFEDITGKNFNNTAFNMIEFFYFIGDIDDREATNEPGYWVFLRALMGMTPACRLKTIEKIYKEKGFGNFTFKFYKNVGHRHTSEMKHDAKNFFYKILSSED